jgi:hypothetical protein
VRARIRLRKRVRSGIDSGYRIRIRVKVGGRNWVTHIIRVSLSLGLGIRLGV